MDDTNIGTPSPPPPPPSFIHLIELTVFFCIDDRGVSITIRVCYRQFVMP
jgi:hypothetical protein